MREEEKAQNCFGRKPGIDYNVFLVTWRHEGHEGISVSDGEIGIQYETLGKVHWGDIYHGDYIRTSD